MTRQLAHYLFQRLEQCGVEYTFGIPGDFALPLYAQQDVYGLKTIVCTHEPNCVFAADAYARLKGFGAVLTTYGVGGLNMINPVAMAYAEFSPVVIISGAPALTGRKEAPAFHHLVKDYSSQQRVFAEVTCATAALTSAENAAEEINRVVDTCLSLKRPGYIEIPIDMTSVEIPIPAKPVQCFTGPPVNEDALREAATEITQRFQQAKRPVLYAGVGIRRHTLMTAVRTIAENWGIPVVSSVMGKAAFPESHPNHVGVYMGEMGDHQARKMVEEADFILAIGVIFSDVNTGFWSANIDRHQLIELRDLEVCISHHTYSQVPLAPLVNRLAGHSPTTRKLPVISRSSRQETPHPDDEALTTSTLINQLKELDQTQFSFLADVGDAWFVGLELDTDVFMAPGYYASMGFAVPGALGAALADRQRRPIVLVGDGAFQMTGNELSSLVSNKLNPLIILLNNRYYKMLSALDEHRDYYNLNNWDYVRFAEALGSGGQRVHTRAELNRALAAGLASKTPYLIEVTLEKTDHAPIMQKIRDYVHNTNKG